jgi:hypothetical protein
MLTAGTWPRAESHDPPFQLLETFVEAALLNRWFAEHLPGKRVLVLGFGDGRDSRSFSSLGLEVGGQGLLVHRSTPVLAERCWLSAGLPQQYPTRV